MQEGRYPGNLRQRQPGRWRSDISTVLRHCLCAQSPGREMTKLLVPEADDYIVLKPKHSPFYASPLQTILDYIGARVAIVVGLTTNACVLIASLFHAARSPARIFRS